MKTILFILALFSMSVFAETETEQAKRCSGYAQVSAAVMKAVQGGMPMSLLLEKTNYNEMIMIIAKEAYKVNVYSTEAFKKRAITDFSNSILVTCMNNPPLK